VSTSRGSQGCFGLKLDRIGAASGLGCWRRIVDS
uniref:Natriuretic peptide NP2 n=1 Tax=Crotalus durissus terrificus TaxID=8732 RepID=ANF_CRODU|nr:RecName: Full=Natriuretic peptide NP2; AltName: Full=NP2_Casca [Crotalus durissus cascavella]